MQGAPHGPGADDAPPRERGVDRLGARRRHARADRPLGRTEILRLDGAETLDDGGGIVGERAEAVRLQAHRASARGRCDRSGCHGLSLAWTADTRHPLCLR
ncbi:hypothetical protein GCM10025870_01500 [Agromyces marinus]|uniref:Uncharacterized protein n=1 Tax=Agromyces marinus TaxID=1389020 RepID=A0ABN6Y6U1_9MICO|nr:hypothetical protein GCM10025870_01500 [Agromyces marinus]